MSQKNQEDANRTFFSYYSSRPGRIFRILDMAKKRLLRKYVGNNKLVLDFGCGTGKITSFLLENGNRVYGLDHDSKLLEIAEKNGIIPVKADFKRMPFRNDFFDVVVSSDSMEHVESRKEAFSEIARVLKKDGELIIFTPAYDSVFWVAGEKVANLITGKKESGHISPFTKESLLYFLKRYFKKMEAFKRINLNLGLFAVAKSKK